MPAPILEVSALSKKFCRDPHLALKYFLHDAGREILGRPPSPELREEEFWALRDVSFTMQPGEVLGVIGHNGAGKSTLINLLAGVMRPTAGRIAVSSDKIALVESGGGLDLSLTGRENVRNRLVLHGCGARHLAQRELAVAEFAGIGTFIDAPVGTYSLGMRQRLAFSIYTQLEPDLFIIDEALSGGDLRFSRKFSAFLKDYIAGGGSILLCSHILPAVLWLCPQSILMDGGRLIAKGDTVEIIDAYQKLCDDREKIEALPCTKNGRTSTEAEQAEEEIKIVSVSAEAEGSHQILPLGTLLLRVVFETSRDMVGLRCGIEIGNALIFPITGLGTDFDARFACGAGINILTFRIPSLPLNSGTYFMRVFLMESGKAVPIAKHGVHEQPCEFVVQKEVDFLSSMAAFRRYIVQTENECFLQSVTGGSGSPPVLLSRSKKPVADSLQ